jgi:hypothetical protein
MVCYIDESGDLGYSFNAPNRQGGSSRYLTLAYFICKPTDLHKINRLVRDIYKKYFWLKEGVEAKGSSFSDKHATYISERIEDMIGSCPDISIRTVTIRKTNVKESIRKGGNILYNYGLVLYLGHDIKTLKEVKIIPDKRSVRVVNGDPLDIYLRTKVNIEYSSDVNIEYDARESTYEPCLWFIDWVANFTWRHFEDGRSSAFNVLDRVCSNERVFW